MSRYTHTQCERCQQPVTIARSMRGESLAVSGHLPVAIWNPQVRKHEAECKGRKPEQGSLLDLLAEV